MNSVQELVRDQAEEIDRLRDGKEFAQLTHDYNEAEVEIAELKREIAHLRAIGTNAEMSTVYAFKNRAEAAEQKVRMLLAALKPFAAMWRDRHSVYRDEIKVDTDRLYPALTVGMLRVARDLVGKSDQ